MKPSFRTATPRVVCVALLAASVFACSSDAGPPPQTNLVRTDSEYSLKVYAQIAGAQVRFDIGPLGTHAAPTPARMSASSTGGGNIRPMAGNQNGPPGPIQFPTSPAQLDLVTAAAVQCGMVGLTQTIKDTIRGNTEFDDLNQQIENNRTVVAQSPVAPPWAANPSNPSPWYIFEHHPRTCDELLEYEETLLCVADRLAQLADAVAPVTWSNVRFNAALAQGQTNFAWLVPPQAEQDKFIARDTAIHVLSHIAWLDAFPITTSPPSDWPKLPPISDTNGGAAPVLTCSGLYAAYDTAPPSQQAAILPLLRASYPNTPTGPLGRARLAIETNTLRAAGQLLHDLVREAVYSDLAGAAHRASTAADPKAGQSAAWGWDGMTPYNNLGHASRVLVGRWEMGLIEPDPACIGVAELDLLSLTDPGIRNRARDSAPYTQAEATAAALMENAGVVVADGATVDLRGVLQNQLLSARAADHGVAYAEYASSPSGVAITSLVSGLSDAELARGAQRARSTFSLLTGNSMTAGASFAGSAGMVGLRSIPNAALDPMLGIIVGGGVGRHAIATDTMARAGRMLTASQCAEERYTSSSSPFDSLMYSEAAAAALSEPTGPDPALDASGARAMRQDVFAIGHALRTRLVKMREAADLSLSTGCSSHRDAFRRALPGGFGVMSTTFAST